MIKKKHSANTPEIKKTLPASYKRHIQHKKSQKKSQKITVHQLKINHNSRCCGLILSLVQILYCKYVNVNVNIILSTPLRTFQG